MQINFTAVRIVDKSGNSSYLLNERVKHLLDVDSSKVRQGDSSCLVNGHAQYMIFDVATPKTRETSEEVTMLCVVQQAQRHYDILQNLKKSFPGLYFRQGRVGAIEFNTDEKTFSLYSDKSCFYKDADDHEITQLLTDAFPEFKEES